jgi:hypothetical protein
VTLQDKLNLLRQQNVPLPLVGIPEVAQALRLRRAGLTYGAIARTMSFYHGSTRSEDSWRHVLRTQGAPPRHYLNGARRVPPARKAAGA